MRLLVLLALCLPAHAQAPEPYFSINCGTLAGSGRVSFVIGDVRFTSEITCGKEA